MKAKIALFPPFLNKIIEIKLTYNAVNFFCKKITILKLFLSLKLSQ